jgi:LPXTG-motif cell wall-anchored protein
MSGARGWLEMSAQPASAGVEETFITRYTQLAADVLPGVVNQAIQIFLALTLLGAVLMLVAVVGAVFFRRRKNKEPAPPAGA